ncbi:hypothetical protein LTS17_001156 [Exophiala oligosperma]
MAAAQDKSSWRPPVFTRADLNPFNILIRGDRVVGLVDWEISGWYPNYWEYTSAWLGSATRTGRRKCIDEFLEPFPDELKMETIRQKWWGVEYRSSHGLAISFECYKGVGAPTTAPPFRITLNHGHTSERLEKIFRVDDFPNHDADEEVVGVPNVV